MYLFVRSYLGWVCWVLQLPGCDQAQRPGGLRIGDTATGECSLYLHCARSTAQHSNPVTPGCSKPQLDPPQRPMRNRAGPSLVRKDTTWTPPGPGPGIWTPVHAAGNTCRPRTARRSRCEDAMDGHSSGRLWTGRWTNAHTHALL
jgi:hypothetical protein